MIYKDFMIIGSFEEMLRPLEKASTYHRQIITKAYFVQKHLSFREVMLHRDSVHKIFVANIMF